MTRRRWWHRIVRWFTPPRVTKAGAWRRCLIDTMDAAERQKSAGDADANRILL